MNLVGDWGGSNPLLAVSMVPPNVSLKMKHNNMEHLALMEKCVGMFPSNMLAKAPRAHEFFDELTGQCKGAEECDAENRRHIRRMKRLQVCQISLVVKRDTCTA